MLQPLSHHLKAIMMNDDFPFEFWGYNWYKKEMNFHPSGRWLPLRKFVNFLSSLKIRKVMKGLFENYVTKFFLN
jgi:hypothetical protein